MSSSPSQMISPLFGEIALNLGLCPASAILDALKLQEEQRSLGLKPERIGQILIERGHLTLVDVRRVMEQVEKQTRTLHLPGFSSLELVSRDASTLRFRGIRVVGRRAVSIKFLRFGLVDNEENLNRFMAESSILSRLDHPNVVRVLEAGELEGIPFLVMEHFHGPHLEELVEDSKALPESQALRILDEAAGGLAHAHALDITHGALSPRAILVPSISGAKVTDFAIPDWPVDGANGVDLGPGRPEYLAPEQARRAGRVTPSSDVYSLGAVFFQMLTGWPPFRGSPQAIVRQHLRRPAPDPRVLASSVSERTAALVSTLLEKNPAKRPASMEDVQRRVDRIEMLGNSLDGAASEPISDQLASVPSRLLSRRRSALRDG